MQDTLLLPACMLVTFSQRASHLFILHACPSSHFVCMVIYMHTHASRLRWCVINTCGCMELVFDMSFCDVEVAFLLVMFGVLTAVMSQKGMLFNIIMLIAVLWCASCLVHVRHGKPDLETLASTKYCISRNYYVVSLLQTL